jgi:hypothetical protein
MTRSATFSGLDSGLGLVPKSQRETGAPRSRLCTDGALAIASFLLLSSSLST